MPNYFIMEMQMMDNKTLVLGKLTESKIRGLIHPAVQLSSQPCQFVFVQRPSMDSGMTSLGDVERTGCSISASDHFGIYNCGQVAVYLVNILGPDSILESNI